MAAFLIVDRLKGYALKLLDILYEASVASVFALSMLIFLAAVVAMAISVKMIGVPPVHPP
jgi:hypothetical protein